MIVCRELHNDFNEKKQSGFFERVRPRSHAEQTAALQHTVTELRGLVQILVDGRSLPAAMGPALRDITNVAALPGCSGLQQGPASLGANVAPSPSNLVSFSVLTYHLVVEINDACS